MVSSAPQHSQQLEKVFTVAETAAALGVHPISIYKATSGMIKMPIPRFVKMGRLIRFREKDVTAFLDGHMSTYLDVIQTQAQAVAEALGTPKRSGTSTKAERIAKRQLDAERRRSKRQA